jgi:hypothetical protein
MRSIRSKIDKVLGEEDLGRRRIDLINHDTVLFNIFTNTHAP